MMGLPQAKPPEIQNMNNFSPLMLQCWAGQDPQQQKQQQRQQQNMFL